MSDQQASAADSLSQDGLPLIGIEALVPSNGLFETMRQPSLGVRLRVADPQPISSDRLDAAFGDYAVRDCRTIVEQAAGIIVAALRRSRFPVLAAPAIQELGGDRWTIRLPIMHGLHGQLADVTGAVVSILARLGAGQDMSPAATRQLQAAIGSLQARAPVSRVAPSLIEAAQSAGVPWQRLNASVIQLGIGHRLRWFVGSVTDRTPYLAALTTGNKIMTTQLLRLQMLPAPENASASSAEDAVEVADRIGYPVVVKPTDRNRGEGVFARLTDAEAVRAAYSAARKYSENVMVERHIPGNDHRLHVLNGLVYRARIRTPGGVIGDGRLSVAGLLEQLNADPERGPPGSLARLIHIVRDDEADRMMADQALSWDSIPEEGRFVALRSIANVATGGETNELPLARVHPDNIAAAERAAGLFGLDVAAVDFICPDIGRSWMEVGGGICEINAGPEFAGDAGEKIVASVFPDGGRISVGLVLGEARSSDWLARVRDELAERGVNAGIVVDGEAWVGNRLVARIPGNADFEGAMMLLRERSVEQLIVKVDSSFLRHGVPCEGIDWLAIDRTQLDEEAKALALLIAPFADRLLVNDGLEGIRAEALPQQKVAPDQWVSAVLAMHAAA